MMCIKQVVATVEVRIVRYDRSNVSYRELTIKSIFLFPMELIK